MSIYKSSSLAMIPTAYKDGKLYSVRPTDGSGDFTFTRGSNLSATRVNASQLIEKGRENLFTNSNDFGSTSWGGSTTETGGQSGYDGSNAAWLIENAANAAYIRQNNTSSGVLTASVYAKAGNVNWVRFAVSNSPVVSIYFDLVNGVSSVPSNVISQTIVSVGNGWHRLSITFLANSMSGMQFYPADGANDLGETGDNIFLQDAQLEQGLVATDYIETGASTAQAGILEDTPRFDYSGGATCPSLLLEPSRTNLLPYSEYFETWSNVNLGTANLATITTNYATSPDGTNNATRIQFDLNGGTTLSDRVIIRQLISTATGRYFSVWMKSATGTDQKVLWHYGGDENEQTITNEWQRFEYDRTSVNLSYVGLSLRGGESSVDTADILVWGFQVESGSYPTSYIPTYGTSQTRSVDNPIISSAGNIIDINQGTLFLDGTIDSNVDTEIYLMKFDGVNFNDTLYLYRSSIGKIQGVYRIGGSAYNQETTGAISGRFKAAFAYDSNNDCTLYVNGSKVGASFSIPTPSVNLTTIRLGGFNDTLAKQSGLTHQSSYFPTALTDSECIALTTI